jgi:probable rRNA maturation factor
MVTLTNLTSWRIDEELLGKIADGLILAAEGKRLKEISIVFISEARIKQINRQYRRKDQATDVLGFEELNEIFICPAYIKKQAKSRKAQFGRELKRALIHGILHLKGYDHEKGGEHAKIMRGLEEKFLQKINDRRKK